MLAVRYEANDNPSPVGQIVHELLDDPGVSRALGLAVVGQRSSRLRVFDNQQREMVLEQVSPEKMASLQEAAEKLGLKVVSSGRPQTTLENLFLEAIEPGASPDAGSGRN